MSASSPPAELTRRRALAQHLSDQWAAAGADAGLCSPGCACGAGMLFSLAPGEIEADVLAYLCNRFSVERDPAVHRVFADRSLAMASGTAPPFGTWLRTLAEVPLDSHAFDAVADSLGAILQSLGEANGAAAPATRFSCTRTGEYP